MFNFKLIAKRTLLNMSFALVAMVALAANVGAQVDAAERQRAIDLYESQNMVAALPLLEKIAAANPNDVAVISRLGFALYATSVTEKDLAARQKMRARAKETLLRSRSLGDSSNLTNMILDALASPDATQLPFSNIRAAEAAIREGEEAFVHGDMDKAIAAYKRALDSDPNLYDAALYAGDAEFKKAMNSTDPQYRSTHFDASGVWFTRAISINPNRETAYRYWGDALNAQGKTNEARDKFVDAIVAEPYGRSPYVGLTQWAQAHKVPVGHPRIVPPNSTTTQGQTTTLNIDPRTLNGNDGSNNWLMYDFTRMAWQKGDFFKNYPDEKAYRHSLKEEATALRMVAEACSKDLRSGKVKALEPSLDSLVQLNDAGFLEAFVLFARADQGIARDYAAYRKDNREKLRRYWLQVAIIQQ